MAHLLEQDDDISILKAYWVNHGIDQNEDNYQHNEQTKSNKRQACVGVYGIDIHPDGSRFATCGADEKVKIWSMAPIICVDIEVSQCVEKLLCVCKYDKNIHKSMSSPTFNNTVHCVKWSNDGKYLASGSADGIVTIWTLMQTHIDCNGGNHNHNGSNNTNSLFTETTKANKNIENWTKIQQLTKHRDTANNLPTDIQDIAFSPCDNQLISAGSDHNIIIWQKCSSQKSAKIIFECKQILREAHYDLILGLSFDPIGEYLCSQSADGSAKIWKVESNRYTLHNEMRRQFKRRSHFIRANTNDDLTRLDVCQRSSWSPDGMHLCCSFGVTEDNIFISPIFDRCKFGTEFSFVGHSKPTTVSKWNPRIYQTEGSSDINGEVFFVAAVGGMDCKLSIWCSNRTEPLKVFSNIGKESVLDMAWSRSGDILLTSTHDGNVMAFVFGKKAFFGNKLSVNQHANYVQHNVFNDSLHGNTIKHLRNNICLTHDHKFNQVKARNLSIIHTEEKQHEIEPNGHSNHNGHTNNDMMETDNKMADDVSSIGSEFVCNEHMFAPEEDEEVPLEITEKYAAFNGILGKQGRSTSLSITDYYNKESNHNNSEIDIPQPPKPSPPMMPQQQNEVDDGIINTLVVRRKKKENTKKKKKKKKKVEQSNESDIEMEEISHPPIKRKRKRNHSDNDRESKKKRRKYNEKWIKMDHPQQIIVFEEKGCLKVESNVIVRDLSANDEDDTNRNEIVCDLKQYNNSNGAILWKTEIPSQVTQIVVNKQWTICGTIDGEIYCFDSNGMLILHPIQLDDEIVFLSMSNLYKSHNNAKEKEIFLLIITGDCTLRKWKICNDENHKFGPIEVLKANISNLLRMNSNKMANRKDKVSLKNAFVASNGEIILTLSNFYIFSYNESMRSWMRLSDDKYWLSNERKSNMMRQNNEDGAIGKLAFKFSELMDSMGNSSKSVTNLDKVKNAEISRMHTISHLEQELMTFTLQMFVHKEKDFEEILMKYVNALIHSSTMESLSFGIDKLNHVFERLLNRNCEGNVVCNKWPGSVRFQRDLLVKLMQVAEDKNSGLQQMTMQFKHALNSCQRHDII